MPKKEIIKTMFDEIAPEYDKLNHIMSFNIDKLWRRVAVRKIVGKPDKARTARMHPEGMQILDVACGTGDSTIAIAKALRSAKTGGAHVIGIDLSAGMLSHVMQKAEKEGVADLISVEQGDCESLRFEDGTFDCITCAFGIRNFEHKEQGLKEMYRVLKSGGRLVILELSIPGNVLIRWIYKLYFLHIMPSIGGKISGDKTAYRYLPASVLRFPHPRVFRQMISRSGFVNVRAKALTFGVCRLFTGTKG